MANNRMVAAAKVTPILAAVSTKNGSGTMFINKSVDGSRIHRSLVKNIFVEKYKIFREVCGYYGCKGSS